MDAIDDGSDTTWQPASNSSRLGIRGSLWVSDSLDLIYQLESGLDLTFDGENNDGNGPVSDSRRLFSKTRPSHLGVSGAAGVLLVGHTDALDQWANEFNPFADQVGDLGNFWAGSGLPGRLDGVIQYRSATSFPVAVTVSYTPYLNGDGDALILRGSLQHDNWRFSATQSEFETETGKNHSAQAFVTYYQTGDLTLGGGFQHESNIPNSLNDDRTSFYVAGQYRLSRRSQARVMFANSLATTDQSDAMLWALGYDYFVNDAVTVYGSLAAVNNENNVNFSVNGKGHGAAITPLPGADPIAFSVGFITRFNFALR